MRKTLVLLFVMVLSVSLQAALTVYPDTPNAVVSGTYSLRIDNTPVRVRDYMDYHYAHFAFDGTVELTVTAPETIHTHRISPLSLGLQGQVSGNTLTFSMTQAPDTDSTPRHLVIQINDLEELVLLGDPLETDAPPSSGTGIFNVVTDFGADNTGATQTQPRIQNAINAAGSYGTASRKGIVFVPPGLYMIHEDLQLRSCVDLYLAPGAVLKSDEDESRYDTSDGTIEPALEIANVHDVVVRGRGELDASGFALMDPVGGTLTTESPAHPRRRIILTDNAANLVIKDIIVKDGTGWSVEGRSSDNVLVQNVKVLNHRDVWYKIQNDGINNVSSDDMHVNQCFVITIDDAACFKARFPGDAAMENGLFSHCVLWNSAAGIKCGMQNNHAMNNVVFRDIDIVHCRRAIAFDTKTDDPPVPISGPVFTDIRCEELEGNFSISRTYVTEFVTQTDSVDNVTISNFTCMTDGPIEFSGNHPVSNVTYNNLLINGRPILGEADVTVNKKVPVTNLVFKADPYVSLSAPGAHGANPFVVTVTFTEEVTGLTADDFVAASAEVAGLAGGPDVYTVTVTPSGQETVMISLPGGVVQDGESNGNRPSNVLEIPAKSSSTLPTVSSGSLYLHLEADAIGAADGDPVTAWTDSAGGHVFTGTATYEASYANGRGAVRFDGIDDILTSTGWIGGPSPANATLFVVGNFTTAETDSVSDFMISGQYPTGQTNNRFRLLKFRDDNRYQFRVGGGGTRTLSQTADAEKHIFTLVSGRSGTSVDFWIDDAFSGSGNSGTSVAMQALGLGGYLNGNNQFADCSIAEVLLYDGALSEADRMAVHDYLAQKYFSEKPETANLGDYSDLTGDGISGYTFLSTEGQQLRISPSGDYIVRVQAIRPGETFLPDDHYEMVADHSMGGSLTLTELEDEFILQTAAADGVEIRITRNPMRLSYYRKGSLTPLAADDNGITWNGTRTDVDFQVSDDRFFGAGHPAYGQLDSLDLTGKEIRRNYDVQAPLIVPFYMSHKGYGIFLNTTFQNRFRFAFQGEYSFGFDDQGNGGRMDYYFILGPRMADMLDRYTQLTGRPRLPQKSIFGLHLSDKGAPDTSDEQWWKDRITEHRAAGYPIDHICNDNRWRAGPGTWANGLFEWAITEGRYPDPAEWAAWTQSNGLTMTLDLNRNTCANSWGWDPSFNIPNSGCVSYNASVPDYSSQEVRNWNWELFWTKSFDPALNYPGDGIWMDEVDQMGCIPDSTITADGRTWAENENYYLFQLAKAVIQEGWDNENGNSPAGIGDAKRPFAWVRGMTAGGQRYATHWTGDITSTYTTMQQQIRAMQASGLSGFPYFNHDAGGFTPGPDDSMYRQWSMAYGSFSPIWRPHGPGEDRWPLYRSAASQADASVYSRMRYEFMPYIYTCAWQACATGMPMARAMVIDYQDEPLAWSSDLQYMWGSQVLVAPNCSEGNNSVSVWLPDGNRWYDFWDKQVVYEPDQVLSYYAPTGILPLFVKEGAVIPKALYATSTFWIPNDTLVLDVYTGRDGFFDLYEDDGVSEYFRTQDEHSITPIDYQEECMVLTVGAAAGDYAGKPENRSYRVNFYGVKQSLPMGVNGIKLPEFATEQEVLSNGYGYAYLPGEERIFVATQPLNLDETATISPVGSNPDTNADGIVDIEDIEGFVLGWLNGSCSLVNCWCDKMDINGDSAVDLADFAELAKVWLD